MLGSGLYMLKTGAVVSFSLSVENAYSHAADQTNVLDFLLRSVKGNAI